MREQSSRHRFDALEENNRTIRSAVSSSARIKSAERAYPIDLAESEAAAAKNLESIATSISRGGSGSKARASDCGMSRQHHRREDRTSGAADPGADRTSNKKTADASSSAAAHGLLEDSAAGERDHQRDYRNNLHRAPSSIKPCHDEAGFRNGPTAYLSVADWLLLIHTTAATSARVAATTSASAFISISPEGQSISGNF
jgi:hypothetical protein